MFLSLSFIVIIYGNEETFAFLFGSVVDTSSFCYFCAFRKHKITDKVDCMENKRPLILVSNDDGIMAKGISELIKFLRPLGEIVVMAPDALVPAVDVH